MVVGLLPLRGVGIVFIEHLLLCLQGSEGQIRRHRIMHLADDFGVAFQPCVVVLRAFSGPLRLSFLPVLS